MGTSVICQAIASQLFFNKCQHWRMGFRAVAAFSALPDLSIESAVYIVPPKDITFDTVGGKARSDDTSEVLKGREVQQNNSTISQSSHRSTAIAIKFFISVL